MLLLNLLPTKFLHQVGYPDPQHTNGHRMLTGFVVHRDLNFVGLVHIDIMAFVQPLIVSRRLRPHTREVLNLNNHKGLRPTRETRGAGMIDVLDRENPYL